MHRFATLSFVVVFIGMALAADKPPVASWSFDRETGVDAIRGFRKFVPGVAGNGLRFDGQTTAVVRGASKAPRLGGAFSIEAWVAIQTYPWTWCAIVNQEKDRRSGYFFGIDPEGRFGLQLAIDGKWRESRSTVRLPLYAWNHLVGTFDPASGIKLYLNGRLVGEMKTPGAPRFAPEADVWVGRNQTPLGLSEEIKVVAPVAFSFDGIIDEIRIYDRVLDAGEPAAATARLAPAGPAPLKPPALP